MLGKVYRESTKSQTVPPQFQGRDRVSEGGCVRMDVRRTEKEAIIERERLCRGSTDKTLDG